MGFREALSLASLNSAHLFFQAVLMRRCDSDLSIPQFRKNQHCGKRRVTSATSSIHGSACELVPPPFLSPCATLYGTNCQQF